MTLPATPAPHPEMHRIGALRIHVGAPPKPALLRAAIEASLAGRPWPSVPEAAVAAAVGHAVMTALGQQGATTASAAASHSTGSGDVASSKTTWSLAWR
jgi:hypothetical protein